MTLRELLLKVSDGQFDDIATTFSHDPELSHDELCGPATDNHVQFALRGLFCFYCYAINASFDPGADETEQVATAMNEVSLVSNMMLEAVAQKDASGI